jgi:hypothetical protein
MIKMGQAVFELIGDNPSTALIVGGILLLVLSAIMDMLEPSTASFLRSSGWVLIFFGIGLNVLWLVTK